MSFSLSPVESEEEEAEEEQVEAHASPEPAQDCSAGTAYYEPPPVRYTPRSDRCTFITYFYGFFLFSHRRFFLGCVSQ